MNRVVTVGMLVGFIGGYVAARIVCAILAGPWRAHHRRWIADADRAREAGL